MNGHAIEPDAVAAARVFDLRTFVVDRDARMKARHQRVVDREVTFEATPDDGGATGQVELLQDESQSVTRHLHPSGFWAFLVSADPEDSSPKEPLASAGRSSPK
jgi:hypothetical protein